MPGLLRGMARTAVVAGTATAVSNRVSRRQGNRWAQQSQAEEQQYAPEPQYAPPPPQAAPPPPQDDVYEQLAKLGKLRDDGILTEAEFTAQKAKVLGT